MSSKFRKLLPLFFLTILVFSYFFKDNYKSVDNIRPELLQAPEQATSTATELISFSKDGYAYNLTPVAEYKIQALVVHRMDYRFFSIHNSDSIFPVDLCLIWGENLENKSYQNKDLSFSQDSRFCFFRWRREASINPDLISNNHLITNDPDILRIINQVKPGDQVSISGYLVNVEAKKVGKVSEYDPSAFNLATSLSRTDSGGGACEIIYIKNIKIIQTGHPIWSFLFKFSLWILGCLIIFNIFHFLIHIHRHRRNLK